MKTHVAQMVHAAAAAFMLLQLAACAGTAPTERIAINTPAFAPIADQQHFAQGVIAGGFLFTSGTLGITPDGVLPVDLETEFRTAFQNVEAVLAEAGLSFDDVVEIMSFHADDPKLDDAERFRVYMKVHDEFLSAPWAAATGIGIAKTAFPGAHLELRVTAKLRD